MKSSKMSNTHVKVRLLLHSLRLRGSISANQSRVTHVHGGTIARTTAEQTVKSDSLRNAGVEASILVNVDQLVAWGLPNSQVTEVVLRVLLHDGEVALVADISWLPVHIIGGTGAGVVGAREVNPLESASSSPVPESVESKVRGIVVEI
jgi:hypothetical protein